MAAPKNPRSKTKSPTQLGSAERAAPTAPPSTARALTHLDAEGRARMVDVAEKPVTVRAATAHATLRMEPSTLRAILDGKTPKGDVLAVARVAGIQAAKRTPDLIPLCHAIALTGVEVEFSPDADGVRLHVRTRVRALDRTGVEMEALVAASLAALTVYDMVKAVDRGMTVEHLGVQEKSGGRSGHWRRD